MDQQNHTMECLTTKTCDVASIYNMWSSIQVHSIRELKSITTSQLVVFVHFRTVSDCDRFRWLLDEKEHKGRWYHWSIYTDLQSFLGTFPIQKVSILAVEDYSFEDELKLVEIRILAYSDSSPDKMCIFWTRFSAKIAFLPISETLQRKVSLSALKLHVFYL